MSDRSRLPRFFMVSHIDREFSGAVKEATSMSIHIGKEIEKKMREQRMSVVGLSRELGCHRTNIYRIFDSATVDTGVLSRLSIILKCDFFKYYSDDIASKLNQFNV